MVFIKRATCQDGQIIAELLKSKYSFVSTDEAEKTYQNECPDHHYRIALDNGRVIGLICWRTQGQARHGVAELTRLAILDSIPNYHEVKEQLFDVMIAEADYYYKKRNFKLRKVFSLIHAENKDIKNFFIDKGMHQEAVLRDHFHRGKDELIYSLFLA